MNNQPVRKKLTTLLLMIWKNVVWCGMIGGGVGLVAGVTGLVRSMSGPSHNSSWIDIVTGIIAGVAMGVVWLGVPASVYSLIKWLITPAQPVDVPIATPASEGNMQSVVDDVSHDAMVGATALVPGAIIGAVAGLAIDLAVVGCLWFISIMTGSQLFGGTTSEWALGLGLVILACTLIGAAAGLFLGSVVGALFGGLRGARRIKSA